MLDRQEFRRLSLTQSFRWRDPGQKKLADALRAGQPATLPVLNHAAGPVGVDVVLSLYWKPLWELGAEVLPLAFQSFKGGHEEAAATLVLNHVARNIFSLDATYLNDALTALAISDRDVLRQIEPDLQAITDLLHEGGKSGIRAGYIRVCELIEAISPRRLRKPHHSHTGRLAQIRERLSFPGRPVPGLTTHQAKGAEWDAVGIKLSDDDRDRLIHGLSVDSDTDRKLYVACTRARVRTVEVLP
ncbi:hypothetical protein GCM10028799_76290 [Kribbella italica]